MCLLLQARGRIRWDTIVFRRVRRSSMTRAEVVRNVAAEPAGIALLLSGPGAYALWPGVDDTTMRLRPPMRSGVGFVVDIGVEDPVLGAARARLSIVPAAA